MYCEYSQYFDFLYYCRYYSADTFGLALIRDYLLVLLRILPVVLQVSRGFLLRVLQALSVSHPLVVFHCEYSQYRNTLNMSSMLEYDVFFDSLRTVSTIIRPVLRNETLTDGRTRRS